MLRTLTADERGWLTDELRTYKNNRVTLREVLSENFGVSAGLLLVCYLGGVILTGVPMRLGWIDGLTAETLQSWGIIAIFLFTVGEFCYRATKDYTFRTRSTQQMANKLELELATNQVDETDLNVVAVKCIQEQEHLLKIYLLRLDDERVRVKYDYESVDIDGRGKSPRTDFQIHREMKMIHFEHLGEHRYSFGSGKIRKPRATPLNLHPRDWPADETWLDLPWDDIPEYYAGT